MIAVRSQVKREAFEKAIHTDEPEQQSIADQIDVDTISIEDSYDGPRPAWPRVWSHTVAKLHGEAPGPRKMPA